MSVYLLSPDQISELLALNTPNVCCVPCDHGEGDCIEEHDLDAPEFAAHKSLLDSWALTPTTIAITRGF